LGSGGNVECDAEHDNDGSHAEPFIGSHTVTNRWAEGKTVGAVFRSTHGRVLALRSEGARRYVLRYLSEYG
jgi:hypothetical protein